LDSDWTPIGAFLHYQPTAVERRQNMDNKKAALVTGGAIRLGYHFAVWLAK